MKTIEECSKVLQMTTKGVLYRLKKFNIIPSKSNGILMVTNSQFERINYKNHNIKEVIYVTQTFWVIPSKMNNLKLEEL